jgi:hypothetical protein
MNQNKFYIQNVIFEYTPNHTNRVIEFIITLKRMIRVYNKQ